MKQNNNTLMEQYVTRIEEYLATRCNWYDAEPQAALFDSMRYSLLAGGKRLRPVFVYDFCRMSGGDWQTAHRFAAAVEMIHTYSLIHDDLPSMDNDDLRRGKPTNHKVYGETLAILAGDAMQSAAFRELSRAPYSAETRIRAVEYLADCAGERGMVGGQVLDTSSEARACTEQEILDIQCRKTGALIRAACVLGVLAGGGTDDQIRAAETFAEHLGLAFQIRDDMLDVIGDETVVGKGLGTDGVKNTFIRLWGLEKCDELVREHTAAAIEALEVFPDRMFMEELSRDLTGRIK